MDIILIPGFWLDALSWGQVTPDLLAAGHQVHALTLPGMDSVLTDRAGITLQDHVDAVVGAIDELDPDHKVVLVGHSGGGAVAYAAVDARPDRVARVIYVDSGPLGDGIAINNELPVVDGEIPFPDWSDFEDEDLIDLTDNQRRQFLAVAVPVPARVANDPQRLSDDPRRYDVPATVIACQFPAAALAKWVAMGVPAFAELGKTTDYDVVELPTGHWPQFTKPRKLARAIIAAIG